MRTSDITLSILIILIFIGMYFYNILAIGIKNIEDDWPDYRCNPMIMPFAGMFGHDTMTNFTYCIQTMQMDYMSTLLMPVNYLFSVLSESTSGLMESIQFIRDFINVLRNFITSIIESIFGVFLNILTQFQVILIKMKDMVAKTIGVVVSMLYILQGSIMTMEAGWKGPPGQMVRFMSSIKI
jgi:hypothetical protein